MKGRCTRTLGGLAVLSVAFAAGACGLLFQEEGTPTGEAARASRIDPIADTADVPRGRGSLRQSEISVHLRRGDLQVSVTPLAESVIRVTAPDTYERLSALAAGHQRIFRDRTGSAVPFQLFLVAVHSEAVPTGFEPEGLTLVNRGLRYRPTDIRAVTPDWERNRVEPQQTLMAVYAFPPQVDLEGNVEVEYQEVRARGWEEILPRIHAERARIRSW